MAEQRSRQIEWLAVLRGLTILLVVMNHVQLVDMATGANHRVCSWLTMPLEGVRMPLFIFCSGGLLWLSRIRKDWPVLRLYRDKFERIVVPFLFFVTVYYGVKILFSQVIKTPVELSWRDYLENFYIFEGHASAPLWFLATLTVLMLLYPLYRWVVGSAPVGVALLALSVAAYHLRLEGLWPENYFHLLSLNRYFVFFFAGILFFRYDVFSYVEKNSRWVLPLSMVLWVVGRLAGLDVLTALGAIVAISIVANYVARWRQGVFGSFRDYIYQIYLLSFFFQGFVELILWRRLFYCEALFWLFYVLNVAAGIYGPLWLSKAVERCPWRPLRLLFGLK